MTVSGLGSARSPIPALAPSRAAKAERTTAERNDFDSLTWADRELIYNVTGERVTAGFDPVKEQPTAFAAVLAAERASGRLAPGQEATAVYLKDLNRRYERVSGTNPVAPFLDSAVDFLGRSGGPGRRIDVSA